LFIWIGADEYKFIYINDFDLRIGNIIDHRFYNLSSLIHDLLMRSHKAFIFFKILVHMS